MGNETAGDKAVKSTSGESGWKRYDNIISLLIGDDSKEGACSINISKQFNPGESGRLSIPGNLNAAFLICLSAENHPRYGEALAYLKEMEYDPLWKHIASFYREGLERLPAEFREFAHNKEISLLKDFPEGEDRTDSQKFQEKLWSLFHPEAVSIIDRQTAQKASLREKRKVKIDFLNPNPVKDVAAEVIFTSNALITIPSSQTDLGSLHLEENLKKALHEVSGEDQLFWYDHPVQIGVEPEKNEIIYGLRHLSETLQHEKKRGNVNEASELTCLLSVSVTHEGLQGLAKDYIEGELNKVHKLPGLNVYLFTEADTSKLLHQVLIPAAERYLPEKEDSALLLKEIIGVDGMYGRHYSFLKAITAFWQVFIAPHVKATFKIDLDQVFPHEALLNESGESAFEHLMSPLWGAGGTDCDGNALSLGMIAGALVNEKDIAKSLFTPDVTPPPAPFTGEDRLFCSRVPQALSTVAEMMTRYDDEIDGRKSCIHRIHVTGGTNGILIDSLRKHRPFTPTFVGRAEDQAYILSRLFHDGGEPALRYVHKDGFIMRHDKEAFAGEAIKAAAIGKLVGDYERIIIFSYYAGALPWSTEEIKKVINPFTGSFVSPIPLNIAFLRLALKAGAFLAHENEEERYKGLELINTGAKKLKSAIEKVTAEGGLKKIFEREKEAWDLYYDILDHMEKALKNEDPFALKLKEKAMELAENTLIRL
ncbi:MAG: hypothetical protein OEV42_09145 [Deltaproteobacteria bacterium]|nr:hypothetical protein [Deltaproteobacteria bacterium]